MLRTLYHIALFLTLILWVSSCKFGPNYQRSYSDIPEEFRFDPTPGDSAVNLLWWEIFRDPNLQRLIETGLRENRDIRIAAARIQEAVAFYGFTKADILPNINYTGSYQSGNFIAGQPAQDGEAVDIYLLAPTLNWEVDFWGKFRRANESAKAELLASQQAHQAVAVSLISEIASAYFQLLDFRNRLRIAEETLESRLESLQIIQARFDQGTIPEIDLNQAQIQKEIAAQAVPEFRRLVVKTENLLNVLIGRPPQNIETNIVLDAQTFELDIPTGLPSDLLNRRPDVLQAEYSLMSQNAQIGVAVAKRFPSFGLTGTYGAISSDLSNFADLWTIGLNITGPLFNFGKNVRRVEVEKYRTEQALMNYENTILNAFADVEDALIEVETYHDQLQASIRRRDAAANAKNLSQERYDGGVTSYLEVLEQERALFDAELLASEVARLKLVSYINLYKALGGGWITSEEAAQEE